jgi:L-ascorbate metabolism protein UlaG (beta-lactamase superfamily)
MDYAFQHGQKPIAYDMLAAGADDAWLKSYINKECPVSQPVAGGQARVWFLGHSGWAIKTQNHLLIFDYFDDTRSRKPDHECLLAGCIKPEELKKMNVTVFSTHEHGDHFSPSIFTWREEIPDAKYVLCWEPGGLEEEYTYIPVHEQAKVNDMNVYVNHSTDLGGGYLVEVDGLVLFHMGDHANGEDNLMAEFTREIDMIAAKKKDIDILFGPIRGCGLGTPEQVKKGTYYTLEKLQPALFVPMHSGNYSIEYQAFVEQAQEDGVDQKMHYVMGKGDMFEYSQEQVVD